MAVLLAEPFLSGAPRLPIKETARTNRWLVFVFAAAFLAPVCAKAAVTIGGDVNHLGIVLYLLFVGAALAIQENLRAARAFPRGMAVLSAVIGIAAAIAPGGVLTIRRDLRSVAMNDSETAFRYVGKHGDGMYFPWNPTAALLVSGKLYHFDDALDDRELGRAPLTAVQMQSGLPPGMRRVAMPPGRDAVSDELQHLIDGWKMTGDAELPGWKIFEKPRRPE
jgi:hypothetical protein